MANHIVDYYIVAFTRSYRAMITVDKQDEEKEYFTSYEEAKKWAEKRKKELTKLYSRQEQERHGNI